MAERSFEVYLGFFTLLLSIGRAHCVVLIVLASSKVTRISLASRKIIESLAVHCYAADQAHAAIHLVRIIFLPSLEVSFQVTELLGY